jgi:addiction module RelB/DinJ family antitoxin
MNDTFINIRTDKKLKQEATKVADNLGFSLSTILNAYLKQLVKTKTIHFEESYEPTPYLKRLIKEADKELAEGKGSPIFDNAKDAVAWLHRND